MSPIVDGDLFVCQRGTTHHKVLAEDLKVATGPAPWTPRELGADLIYWFDFTDTNKVTVVAGDLISQIVNDGSAGGVAKQTVASSQMTYATVNGAKAATQNKNPAEFLQTDTTIATGSEVYAFSVVTAQTVAGQAKDLLVSQSVGHGGNVDSATFVLQVRNQWAGSEGVVNGASVTALAGAQLPGTDSDGVSYSISGGGYAVSLTAPRELVIGAFLDQGGSASYGGAGGAIHETLAINRLPLPAELQMIEGYFAHRPALASLGLAAKLPANHPYKAAPPTL